jgi:hypothetical protein
MNTRPTSGAESGLKPAESRNEFLRIWSAHGDQLRWIAETILVSKSAAQVVVVDVIAACCKGPLDQLPSRHELARMTYLGCLRAGAVSYRINGRPDRDRPDSSIASIAMVGLRVLAQHQRAAVALVELGDHSRDDVADLLGLSLEIVDQLLVAGRRAVEPAPPPGREPGPGLIELVALLAHES